MRKPSSANPTIFVASASSDRFSPISRTSFAEQGIGEGSHLQKWVLHNPEVLGEELLVVAREYDGFDRSNKRLDILALDSEGKLVVIELKLNTAGHFADLQAINYAAMVSTMIMKDAIRLYSRYHDVDEDSASASIASFLGTEGSDLPELDNRPRIIVAAGGFGGLEITSTALWLRTFGIDIKLVEIAPYTGTGGQLILVPRVVIPIPEAAEYMVGQQRKDEAQRVHRSESGDTRRRDFLGVVFAQFQQLDERYATWLEQVKVSHGKSYLGFQPAGSDLKHVDVHYEWAFDGIGFTAGLHFERKASEKGAVWNANAADYLENRVLGNPAKGSTAVGRLRRTRTWSWVGITIAPVDEEVTLDEDLVRRAVQAMDTVVKATEPHWLDAVKFADMNLQGAVGLGARSTDALDVDGVGDP